MSYKRIAVLAALSLVAACGSDSISDPLNTATSGSLSFSYTGGGGGTFSATGGVSATTLSSTPYNTTWAAGYVDATDNSTNVAANIPRTSTTSDFILITVKGRTTQTATIASNCTSTTTTACTTVTLVTGQSMTGSAFSNICTLTNGSVTVSALTSTNATGSFSGSGTCISGSGTSTSAWVVTNGTFSVPLLPTVPNLP